jgi:nucleotide-binding universal stress UspA family protein
MHPKKILVPLDGSALAETAIPHAVSLAKEQQATLSLVRAAEAPWLTGEDVVDAQVTVVRDAEEYLAGLADRLHEQGVHVETSVWYGAPAASIVDAAKAQHADLIVMTSHGRSGLERLIMGSVAESVLRGTATPVLLLRGAGAAGARPVDDSTRLETASV